jgi:glycosyltransferase involved in cell wall biosynthesis
VRVLFLTHYWAPEIGAPQTRLLETVRGLARLGNQVRVVTNQPHYPTGDVAPGYSALATKREAHTAFELLRLPVIARPNRGFFNRVIDQASFALMAGAAVQWAHWADVLVVESPPLFLGATGIWLSWASGRPYVLHVADPWPDYPIEVGALRSPWAISLARSLEAAAYTRATTVTTPTAGCAQMIEQQPGARGKVVVIPNGVDTARFDPLLDKSVARSRLGWDKDTFTFVYAGTIGLAQGIKTLAEAALELARGWNGETSPVPIVRVVGDGAEREALSDWIRQSGAENVILHDPVGSNQVPTLLAAADVVVIALRRGRLAEAALPTKLVEGMAAGRPVLIAADGVSATIIASNEAGLTVQAEDASSLARAMRRMALSSAEVVAAWGRNGRAAAVYQFEREVGVKRLADVLYRALRNAILPS